MFNIFIFTKVVTNMSKLDREIKLNATFGSLYSHINLKGDQVEIHFTANLNQTQIDALSAFIAAFSNVSVYDTLNAYLRSDIDPFVTDLLIRIRAENIELGITQAGKSLEVLGFFDQQWTLPGKTRSISLKSTLDTASLNVTIELLMYLIANPDLYSDLSPFVTATRLTEWKNKIIAKLS